MYSMEINLQPILSHIANALHTNIYCYDLVQNEWTACVQKLQKADPLFQMPEIKSFFLSDRLTTFDPALVQINSIAVYSLIRCQQGAYLIGPVQLPDDIKCMNHLDVYPSDQSFDEYICYVPMTIYVENVLLLRNLFHSEPIALQDYASQGQFVSEIDDKIRQNVTHVGFSYREEQIRHTPYDNELKNLKAIEEGRLDLFENLWRDSYHPESLTLLSRDPVRAAKYFTIMSITLASRAAIRGGVLPETALTLCDSYVLQIDELKDPQQLESIARTAWINYAYLAADSKTDTSVQLSAADHPLIAKCKAYVFLHLHEKLSVNQISTQMHVNPTYLTNLFKKHEGISLYQFVLNEKINQAKNMLIYTNFSYIDIANYLGFASQSHLNQMFKRATGMSPRYFRNMYRAEKME